MKREFGVALRMTLVSLVLTGILYPIAMTGIGQIAFHRQANGSMIVANGKEIGSELIGEAFQNPAYLYGRPSNAGSGYDARASGGSNWGPTSRKLHERAVAIADSLRALNPVAPGPVPVELVTASGSGLDPDVSPGAALWQAPRVAAARRVSLFQVQSLIRKHVERPTFGILGEARVNVLLVNIALDRQFGKPAGAR